MTPPPEPDAPDDAIDEALQETFPASDAPANTGETGIRVGRIEPAAAPAVHHDQTARQFVVTVGGERAYLQYEESPRATTIIHTEVPASLAGRGIGGQLAATALAWARAKGTPVIVACPFVREYVKKHRSTFPEPQVKILGSD